MKSTTEYLKVIGENFKADKDRQEDTTVLFLNIFVSIKMKPLKMPKVKK